MHDRERLGDTEVVVEGGGEGRGDRIPPGRGRVLGIPGQFDGAGHEALDPPVRGHRFVQGVR